MKLRPLIISCATMLPAPIGFSFLDSIDHWGEPLMLMSSAFAWPLASLIESNACADRVFFVCVFVGSALWIALLLLPSIFPRCRRMWFSGLQLAYAVANAWMGMSLIASKHC